MSKSRSCETNLALTVVSSADQPAAVVHPEMPVQVRRAALAWVRAAPDNDRATDTTLCAQRVVGAQVKVRPDRAGVRHCAQTARMRTHPMRDVAVPTGRRRRRRGLRHLRRQQRR